MYNAYFKCANGCDEKYELSEIVYSCKKCGGLLEVFHEIQPLKQKSAKEWKELFRSRRGTTEYPYGSGVWSKKELVLPNIDSENVVSMFEGNSNLFWAKRFGDELGLRELWIKQCGVTHTGSFKDLGMTVLVSQVNEMMKKGVDIKAVACASTGDTSAALAAYGAYAGIPTIVFLPRGKISTAQLVQPIANNAIVLALDTDFDGCMKIVKEITKDESIYLANSMNSLRVEGQKTVGMEIVEQFDWEVPDTIVIPSGNAGNVSALGKGLMMFEELGIIKKRPRIVVAQAHNANPLYLAYKNGFKNYQALNASTTLASAIQIGNPVSYSKAVSVIKEFNGIVEEATEEELADAAARGDKTGLYNCPHTAVALACLIKLLDKGVIGHDERVVVISTAHGLKFSEFKVNYHEGKLSGIKSTYKNSPLILEANADKVREAVEKAIAERCR